MAQNDGGDFAKFFVVMGLVAIACLVIFASKWLGINLDTSLRLVARLLVMTCLTGLILYISLSHSSSWSMFALGNTWPLLLGGYWVCFWPVLEYKASMDATAFIEGGIWWNAWYTKWGVLFTSVFGGYALKWLQKR